jgi:hypothetical protein
MPRVGIVITIVVVTVDRRQTAPVMGCAIVISIIPISGTPRFIPVKFVS